MAQIPDNLLLLPSSKIVSSRNGEFKFSEDVLLKVLNSSKTIQSATGDTPVIILSILGAPSNEKYLLMRSFIDYYESSGTPSTDTTNLSSDDDTCTSSKTRSGMDFDLSSSGVYLINKPFTVQLRNDVQKSSLIWIMYLYRGPNGTEYDVKLLQRFVLLASSRIAEIKFDNEQFQVLREWTELDATLGSFRASSQLCHSFLYVFPSQQAYSNQNLILNRTEEAKSKLSRKMQPINRTHPVDQSSLMAKLGDVNIIEMSKLNWPYRYDNNATENDSWERCIAHQGLLKSIQQLHLVSKVSQKVARDGRELQHGNFFEFLKDCATLVNDFNEHAMTPRAGLSSSQPQNQPGLTRSQVSNDYQLGGEAKPIIPPRHPATFSNRFNVSETAQQGRVQKPDETGSRQTHKPSIPALPPDAPSSASSSTSKMCTELREHDKQTVATPHQGQQVPPEGQQERPRLPPFIPPKPKEAGLIHQKESDLHLARKLMPQIVDFFQKEMTRYLCEDVYPPKILREIAIALKNELLRKMGSIFNLSDTQKGILESEVTTLLKQQFLQFQKQNRANLKKKQEFISKCQQKVVSSFMESVEDILSQHPNGLEASQLEQARDKIINELRQKFKSEIKGKVREWEDVEGHVTSLMVEIDEYWECVVERNTENFRAAQGRLTLKLENKRNLDIAREKLINILNRVTQLITQTNYAFSSEEKGKLLARIQSSYDFVTDPASSLERIQEEIRVIGKWTNDFELRNAQGTTFV